MAGHARLSPSAADRWMTCPGSVDALEGVEDRGSDYAREGTGAHALFETVLRERYEGMFSNEHATAYAWVGKQFNVAEDGQEPIFIAVDHAMAEHVQSVLDYVARRVGEMGPTCVVYAERRVSPKWATGHDESDGTADCTLVSDTEIEVIDLKYGRGVLVEIGTEDEPNGQLMFYLLGALDPELLSLVAVPRKMRITVAQPRIPDDRGLVRSLKVTDDMLKQFVTRVLRAYASIVPGAPRVASEKGCKFCAAKRKCKEYATWSLDAVGAPTNYDSAAFSDSLREWATQAPGDMDPAAIVRILENADILRGLIRAYEEWAHEGIRTGSAPAEIAAAFKLVRGRSQRRYAYENDDSTLSALTKIRWKDPATEKTTGLGKKDITEQKLKSPSQVETLLKAAARGNENFTKAHWDAFNRLVTKPEGALQLVPISDPRPAANPKDPEAMFGGMVDTPVPEPTLADMPAPRSHLSAITIVAQGHIDTQVEDLFT